MLAKALHQQLTEILKTFPDIHIRAEGWNDLGDLMQLPLRGDVRLERDIDGNPIITIR